MLTKVLKLHFARICTGLFQKREINALTKLLGGVRFAKPERVAEVAYLKRMLMTEGADVSHGESYGTVWTFNRACKISEEQSAFGLAWLHDHYFKKNAAPRAVALRLAEEHGSDLLTVVRGVVRFDFIGVIEFRNQYDGQVMQAIPLYRAFDATGKYFDYAPIHWSEPVFIFDNGIPF